MINNFFSNSRVVVTGAAGTVGKEIVKQLLELPVIEVRALDNNETDLFFLGETYRKDSRLQVFLADVRDPYKFKRMFRGMDYAFHAAAFKHVPLCERSPFDAVQTNIIGVQNVIQSALDANVKKVLFTSSDKAVNPTNVMGTSKLMGERLFTAANAVQYSKNGTLFTSTRFGNVAGSRGSVIQVFYQQIKNGGPVILTDSRMTRFIMSLNDAVKLVMKSMVLGQGGEVFVTKMRVLRIKDLAEVMIQTISPVFNYNPADIEIKEVGARPGEKFYEELTNAEEIRRCAELDELIVIFPAFHNIYAKVDYIYPNRSTKAFDKVYNSANEKFMSKDEILNFLLNSEVLPHKVQNRIKSD